MGIGKYDFSGKVAVVTGAAQGIGLAIARRFVRDGAEVTVMLDMNEEPVRKSALELAPNGRRAIALRCNVADAADVTEVFGEIHRRFGRVDILVNNAGITRDGMFHKMPDAQFRQVMEVNFFGMVNCCRAVIGGMRERNYGKIVNISSVAVFGNLGQSNYASSKGAMDAFTRVLARESGRRNITVNSIYPGMIATDILQSIPPDQLAKKLEMVAMNRCGTPDELASVAAFLSSDDSSFVTGVQLMCCGGMYTRA